jgi:hypothetical protein
VASETGWSEQRILFMPLSRLAQYQHCLFRQNSVRTHWSNSSTGTTSLKDQLEALRNQWKQSNEPS